MARPKKLTLDFLIHDAYASASTKIRRLERRHKNDGYAVYFKLLERLCREDGMRLDLSDIGSQELMTDDLYLRDVPHLLAIIATCVEVDLFDKQLWESERVVFSHGLHERYLGRLKEREAAAKRKQDSTQQRLLRERIDEVSALDGKVITRDNDVNSRDNDVSSRDNDVSSRDNDMSPCNNDVSPCNNDVSPCNNDVSPCDNDVNPRDNDVNSCDNGVNPRDNSPDIRDQNSDTRIQIPEFRIQRSEFRYQNGQGFHAG